MTSETLLEELLHEIAEKRAEIVRERCRSNEDLLALATVYAVQADQIWQAMGGEKVAAAQFHSWAKNSVPRIWKQTAALMIATSFLIGLIVGIAVN